MDLALPDLVNMFDLDRNGFVDEQELRTVLGRLDFRPTPEEVSVVGLSELQAVYNDLAPLLEQRSFNPISSRSLRFGCF